MIDMRQRIVEEARSWNGTPYHNQAKLKGVGVDCAMLVVAVAQEVGALSKDINIDTSYSPEWALHNRKELMCELIEQYQCVRTDELLPGNIITFRYGRVQSHMGIMLNNNQFIHAVRDIGFVVINELAEPFLNHLGRIYTFPGI